MPRTAIEVTATTEVELAPALKRKLLMNLNTYADLKSQADELKEEMAAVAAVIEDLRVEADAKSIRVDDYLVTLVDGGTTTKYDDRKLLAAGLTPAQLESCKVTKPKKGHTKITIGGKE